MSDHLSQDENPYASPGHTTPAGVDPDGKIYPAIAPADVLDIFVGIVNVSLVVSVVLAFPVVAHIAVLRLLLPVLRGPWTLIALIVFVPTLCWLVWVSCRIVRWVSIDEDGLHFQCKFGVVDHWPWHAIVAIGPASRWEVAWDGWIRPLLNPRERTSCMSALGHYRIQGKTDYRFFPPKNPEAFLQAIARYRPELLQSRSQDQIAARFQAGVAGPGHR